MSEHITRNTPDFLIPDPKIGLLTSTGTYNVENYAWAYECWKRQQQTHWMGEDVPMGEDVKDWAIRLSSAEKNLLTQIFRFFTQSDVEVGDNYMKRYMPIFQPLSVQMMLAAFTNMETIHMDAYALLLKTLGMPQAEFEAFKEYSEMTAKHDYMSTFGVKTHADVARTLAMFGAFTEGLALFASFAMLMNFPRFGKMRGMGQIVTYSVRDESLHCEGVIRLFHEWCKETGCLTDDVKRDIVDCARTMVALEDKFIDLAFEMGPVKGMEPDEIKAYIRYIADWRLTQLKLTPIYGYFEGDEGTYKQAKPHPLPWLTEILNGVEHANFFEARATEYSKNATTGSWEGETGVWSNFDQLMSARMEAVTADEAEAMNEPFEEVAA